MLGIIFGALTLADSARAQSIATITPSLFPDRLDARGALTLAINTGGEFGASPPVRRAVLEFPPGLSLDIPSIRSCSARSLRARGPSSCPAQSKIGHGHALVEAHAGSQLISETITLWVFLGPPRDLQPTFEVFGEGYTPLQERVVLSGAVIPGRAPFGEALVIDIPRIPTLPLEPDASIVTATFTVGTGVHRLAHDANTVVVPGSCPVAGFPFAAEFTYADGSTASALASAPCPR